MQINELTDSRILDMSTLIIDDECDQASVNTKKTKTDTETDEVINDPTKTNERIRSMLINLCNENNYEYIFPPITNEVLSIFSE